MEHTIFDTESHEDIDEREFNFQDETANLDIPLSGKIVVVADLGLWNGRRNAYKVVGGTPNVNQILLQSQGDRYRVFFDDEDGEVKAEDIHHDGTNRYTFRELRTDVDTDGLWRMLMDGGFSGKDLNRYTVSLGEKVRKVYGW